MNRPRPQGLCLEHSAESFACVDGLAWALGLAIAVNIGFAVSG
jgi:hypothetical protein